MARITVESGIKKAEIVFMTFGIIVFCLFCRAGFIISKEPPAQVYVNGLEIEKVMR
ncbi:hypothetical protein M0R04_04820 [Candidatus Dojkabacteria bacterium]|jgi:hypothetical protein|nr:hypothetical protein [Candidatus Dojkabacteria bacterium]